MRLLPWLANPGDPAMSPLAKGKKGTRHADKVIIIQLKQGRLGGGTTQKLNGTATNTRDPCACGQ